MRPVDQLKFEPSDDGTILVSGYGRNDFKLNGSSIPCSVTDQSVYVETATFVAPSDKKSYGVLAIHVRDIDSKGTVVKSFSFLLAVTWKEKKPYIDEDFPWTPPADRLGQAYRDYVSVKVEDVVYVSSEKVAQEQGYKYVPDGNLICKFLASDVEIDALEDAATEFEKEKLASEKVKDLEQEIGQLNAQLELSKILDEQQKKDLREKAEKWGGRVASLKTTIETPWRLFKNRIKQARNALVNWDIEDKRSLGELPDDSLADRIGPA